MTEYDIIVLGSGPGGYVTAIRASQLGFKTAIIEKESLGGVCLNWGCIPTKALLKSAQVFEYLKHANDYGLTINEYDKDFDAVVNRSRSVAAGMSKGVQFLMKKNKIDVIEGHGKIMSGKKISVTQGKKTEEYQAKNIKDFLHIWFRKLQEIYGEYLHEAVSLTTRDPRPGEIDGVDYSFRTVREFNNLLDNGGLVEDIEYNGNFYGLAYDAFDPTNTNIVIVEPNGLAQVKDKLKDRFNIVVIKMDENDYTLLQRFAERGDAPEVREKRIHGDKTHFAEVPFKYLINSEFLLLDAIIREHAKGKLDV